MIMCGWHMNLDAEWTVLAVLLIFKKSMDKFSSPVRWMRCGRGESGRETEITILAALLRLDESLDDDAIEYW